MFRIPGVESAIQAVVTLILSSFAFFRTDSYELTTTGKVVFILAVIILVALIRSAVVPPHQVKYVYPLRQRTTVQQPASEDDPGMLGMSIFVILMLGIVKWSWFGIPPRLALLLGTPVSLYDKVLAAGSISLLVGSIALAAFSIADSLQVIRMPRHSRWFVRTSPTHP